MDRLCELWAEGAKLSEGFGISYGLKSYRLCIRYPGLWCLRPLSLRPLSLSRSLSAWPRRGCCLWLPYHHPQHRVGCNFVLLHGLRFIFEGLPIVEDRLGRGRMTCLELDPALEDLHGVRRLDFNKKNVLLARRRSSLHSDRHMPKRALSISGLNVGSPNAHIAIMSKVSKYQSRLVDLSWLSQMHNWRRAEISTRFSFMGDCSKRHFSDTSCGRWAACRNNHDTK